MMREAAVAALVCAVAGFAGGHALKGRLDEARIARIEAAHAKERQAAAEAAAQRLAAAQAAERQAVHALHATRQRLAAVQRRLKEELYALPTAGRCGLSGAARGLLNDRLFAAGGLPEAAGEPDRGAAAAVADPGDTAEAELGGWIAEAVAAYDTCRARIDAIRQWDEVTHGR